MGFLLPQLLLAPCLLAVPVDGAPVRFGAPLPAAALGDGLRLAGPGVLQWRRLPVGGPAADPVWVELAIVAPRGTARIMRGGIGPAAGRSGPALVFEQAAATVQDGCELRQRWSWCDGTVDERVRTVFHAPVEVDGEVFGAGEALTTGDPGGARAGPALLGLGGRFAVDCGLLPVPGGGGVAARAVRVQLAAAVQALRELPGRRGAGDFARSGGVVTNLEFDTAFGLLRAAFGCGSERAFELALRATRHLVDRDLDAATGLPFPHGPDHRVGVPEPGHAWLRGLLWVGLLTADDDLLHAARQLGRALAAHPPSGRGPRERLRDYAWPLAELEALLAIDPDPVLARAADRLAASIAGRFDAGVPAFCFGEGKVGARVWFERAWLTGGLLLPALDAHLRRRPAARLEAAVAAVRAALFARIGHGHGGLPTHWRCAAGRVFAEHRESGTPAVVFLLDAAGEVDLRRLLRHAGVRRAVDAPLANDDPDLPTSFSVVARCDWVWR